MEEPTPGWRWCSRAALRKCHGMLPSQGYKDSQRSSLAGSSLEPRAKQAGVGRRGEVLLPGHWLTPLGPSLNTGVLFLPLITRNRSVHAISGLCGWRQLLRLQWDTHTERGGGSCRNPNPAISSLFISSLYRAPQGKCYQTVSEHSIQQRPSFGKRTKERQNKRWQPKALLI